jgi:hypothetical protein
MHVKDALSLRRRLLTVIALVLLIPSFSYGQAVVKVNDNISFRVGALVQAWADAAQSTTAEGYAKNLFLRRMRLIVSGTLTPTISFFFQTDNPNLGKAPKALGSGFLTQDAYLEWKPRSNAFMIDAGLMLPPFCRDCLGSAGALLSLDYNSWSFLASAPTQSSVGRDTGFQAKGYLADGHFEYRAALLQGIRVAATTIAPVQSTARNGFRITARGQYNVWDTETGYVYPEVYFGNKRILAIGAGLDHQQDFKAYTVDGQLSVPVAKNAFNGILTLYSFDGGTTFAAIPEQKDFALQAGFYLAPLKVMPFVRLEKQDFKASSLNGNDNNREQLGLGWYPNGNNFNIKAAYTRVDPRAGRTTNQYTAQMQFFYY